MLSEQLSCLLVLIILEKTFVQKVLLNLVF